MKSIWTRNDKPLLVLAPMAGYTDSAFRELCKIFGADIVMTELISADSIYHNKRIKNQESRIKCEERSIGHSERSEESHCARILRPPNRCPQDDIINSDKTLQMMKFSEEERPVVVQLFGKYPEKFAYAAKWVEENIIPDGIDINMGCPARKVVGSDHGAALLKNPKLACEIVKTVRESIKLPLSVKTRLGWKSDNEILDFAPKLIEAGVDALIIHGRTYKDGFKGKARWENIYKLQELLKLQTKSCSIIGNGDIGSYEEAMERAEAGGIKLDGVAIGRASFGNPWIFDTKFNERTSSFLLRTTILRHAKLAYERKGDHGIIEFRKHLATYLRGQDNASELRKLAVRIVSLDDVKKVVSQISGNPKS
jgi:tRNA-dihydrouridine synthase B